MLNVRVLFWNVNGQTVLLKSNFIASCLFENFDICFITETHLCVGERLEIKNYYAYHNSYSPYDSKYPRGGISCFIVPTLLQHIADINLEVPNYVVLTFHGGDKMFGNYIPAMSS